MEISNAYIKDFTVKVGKGKSTLRMCAPLTPQLARELRVHSVCFTQENMPKPEILETKLNIRKSCPFSLRLEVKDISHVLNVQIDDTKDWVANQKGTSKKGKPTKMMIEFKAVFTGSAIGVFEWIERYGGAAGVLSLTDGPSQPTLVDEKEKKRGKAAAAGEVVQ